MSASLYLVAGLGKTGYAVAHYLQRQGIDFALFDTRANPQNLADFQRDFPHVKLYLEKVPESLFPHLTAVIVSPGIAGDIALFHQAFKYTIPIYGDIEFFAKRVQAPVIALTGTNGKTTVASLVGEIASAEGLRVMVAGNIGEAVLSHLDDVPPYDLWVLELSSFQLELTHSLKPLAATILNISPDHLDRHRNMAAYQSAKQRIYAGAKNCIYNRQDSATKCRDKKQAARFLPYPTLEMSFGLDEPPFSHDWGIIEEAGKQYLVQGTQKILDVEAMRIKGSHNYLNALAACALASTAGVSYSSMAKVLSRFTGLEHRCQLVLENAGVQWINDSKGTNIGATISAIESIGRQLTGRMILIAGGIGKGADFSELLPAVSAYVKTVLLIGRDADQMEAALKERVAVEKVSGLNEAIEKAQSLAVAGDTVLFSPACASQDMFRDFNERGELFMAAVRERLA